MLQLFRVLLPSWKFFDGVAPAPELFYRICQNSGLNAAATQSPWTLCIPKIKSRSFENIFINEYENYLFSSHALIEYLKDDLREGCDPSVSLELVRLLVIEQMRDNNHHHLDFQFMLSPQPIETEAFYISEICRAQS
jgi:hypothetical protein